MIGWRIWTGILWTVTLAGGASPGANTRTGTAVNNNPKNIGPGWWGGCLTFIVVLANGAAIDAMKIYGSHESIGFPPVGDYAAGAPNAIASTFFNPGANQGQYRVLGGLRIDGGPNIPGAPLPEWLMFEYDTIAGGAGTTSIRVVATLMGPEITGRG